MKHRATLEIKLDTTAIGKVLDRLDELQLALEGLARDIGDAMTSEGVGQLSPRQEPEALDFEDAICGPPPKEKPDR